MKVCIVGGTGRLGSHLNQILQDYVIFSFGRNHLDITNFNESYQILKEIKPEVIIHAAAYTSIKSCEEKPEIAFGINAAGTANIAKIAQLIGCRLIFISTDYVFDGAKEEPYNEKDIENPINIYGKSKLQGELEIKKNVEKYFIIRTGWLFGHKGKSLEKSILNLSSSNTILKVVDDQRCSPTYIMDFCNGLKEFLLSEDYGTYHLVNSGNCSWYEFAKEICTIKGIGAKVVPMSFREVRQKAKLPKNSSLNNNSCIQLRSWEEALEEYLIYNH